MNSTALVWPILTVEFCYLPADPPLLAGQEFAIADDPFVIGRAAGCHLRIGHAEISRQHAQLQSHAERYSVIDLGSTNGVYLNGQALVPQTPQLLKDGDLIALGDGLALRFADPAMTRRRSSGPRPVARGLWLHPEQRSISLHGRAVVRPLPPTEFALLSLLVAHTGQTVPREQIIAAVWPNAHGEVSEAMIENTVARLRKQLASLDAEHHYVETVRGLGYRFVPRG